ncbi:hydrophobin [Trichoderma virens Gv29-8]|uniref:Hydrophobin n=2 Tax=Hypocrea virens TaxID=29875 RepID=G9MR13_HYPVG|nr:hydrophobin [Trichoderma virens Gv29-8]ABS59372.1 hydrophobin [Trichoderma virens]EHK22540.1 hydrophobin [Trichoderma virens Gv29-8]UKZ47583.1 hypothetical protein TrVGV298_001806 [Trichoderma virens]
MNFFTAAALFAAVVVAHPLEHRSSNVCPDGLFSNPLCCATAILGLVGLDCQSPPRLYDNAAEFQTSCAKLGHAPFCCVAPVANQGILCQKPVGN